MTDASRRLLAKLVIGEHSRGSRLNTLAIIGERPVEAQIERARSCLDCVIEHAGRKLRLARGAVPMERRELDGTRPGRETARVTHLFTSPIIAQTPALVIARRQEAHACGSSMAAPFRRRAGYLR
jgi:hypothetical protein